MSSNLELTSSVVAVAAVFISIISVVISSYVNRRSLALARAKADFDTRPFLVISSSIDNVWSVENVGAGPAVVVLVEHEATGKHPTSIGAIAARTFARRHAHFWQSICIPNVNGFNFQTASEEELSKPFEFISLKDANINLFYEGVTCVSDKDCEWRPLV